MTGRVSMGAWWFQEAEKFSGDDSFCRYLHVVGGPMPTLMRIPESPSPFLTVVVKLQCSCLDMLYLANLDFLIKRTGKFFSGFGMGRGVSISGLLCFEGPFLQLACFAIGQGIVRPMCTLLLW